MIFSLNEYQEKSQKYRLPTANDTYALLGLGGEVGEINSLVAKSIRDGVQRGAEFNEKMAKELGDVLWFVASIAQDLNISLQEIAVKNLEKLQGREDRGTIKGNGDNR